MAQIPADILDSLAPIFKGWVKEAIQELVPALTELHSPSALNDGLPEYLSPGETSKLLGLSLPTLRKHTKAGIYTAYRVGKRKIQYKKSEIERALHERRIDYLIKSPNQDTHEAEIYVRSNKKGGRR